MPKFTVTINKVTTEFGYITVTAADEDAADARAQEILEAYENGEKNVKIEWEVEDESFEIVEVVPD